MALFILRYCSALLIFSLGLRAPGIAADPPSNYHSFDDGTNPRSRYYQGVSHTLKF